MGMIKVKIPSNYDPLTRTYHGDWDGTFSTESLGHFRLDPNRWNTKTDHPEN